MAAAMVASADANDGGDAHPANDHADARALEPETATAGRHAIRAGNANGGIDVADSDKVFSNDRHSAYNTSATMADERQCRRESLRETGRRHGIKKTEQRETRPVCMMLESREPVC